MTDNVRHVSNSHRKERWFGSPAVREDPQEDRKAQQSKRRTLWITPEI
jgi:hypothetical protein